MQNLAEECDTIDFKPIECANTKVIRGSEPLPQVVKHFVTVDSLSFEVKDFSSSIQPGQKVMLEIITKDSKGDNYPRGGCEVAAVAEARTGERKTAQIVDNNDGTYTVDYIAQKVGEIDISVFVNGKEIKKSPFKITVQENINFNKETLVTNPDFDQLWGIACSSNGMWAVVDFMKHCVYVYDSQDRLFKKFGGRGSNSGRFIHPCGVAFDSTNELYITDRNNHRVQKFDVNCNYLLQFGGEGAAEGQLNYPVGITTHQDKVYVADRDNRRISVFQNDGKFYGVIGQCQLSGFFDITININSEILVADWRHHCIHVFSRDGHYINDLTLHKGNDSLKLEDSCSLTTDSDGYILIADPNNHCISIFDNTGNCLCCVKSDSHFKFPHGIDIDCNSNIYVSDSGNKGIQIFPAFKALYFGDYLK